MRPRGLRAGTWIQAWLDDSQVADLEVGKLIGAQGEAPKVWLRVERWSGIMPMLISAAQKWS